MFLICHRRSTPIPSKIPLITPQVTQMFFRRNEGHEAAHVSDAANAIISTTKYDESSRDSSRAKDGANAPNHLLNTKSYTFLFMNIARLLTKSKPKIKFLSDLCESHTLFLCLCETFLSPDISDNELVIPDFTITRCDRKRRMGGGVCIYIRNSVIFDTCLRYSNSVCDLLIVRLHTPSLIIMLVYRPPSCSMSDFNDITLKIYEYVHSLSSPLPNIIMLGDFNFPGMNWSTRLDSCPTAAPLISLTDSIC